MTLSILTSMSSTSPAPKNPKTGYKEGIVLILSSPSGAGKTTLCQSLMKKLPELRLNISHTTRSPRENEIDGKSYFFISEKKFQTMRERGDFLEWAIFSDNYYGTSFESIKVSREKGHDVLLEIDAQGAETLRKLNYPGFSIFILPPSIKELTARLKNRGTESDEIINQRLEIGTREIKGCLEYDYILTNHTVEETVENIISIFNAEKLRTSRFVPESADIQALLFPEEKV
jgi:guanylate kinase